MQVILRQGIDNLGKPGDVVTVRPGYARNYLLPRGLAYEATPGNLKRIAQERSRLEAAENERREAAQGIATKLEEVSLTFSARVGEEGKLFGSVTAAQIADLLAEKGFEIDRRKIALREHIKEVGEHTVPVRLRGELVAELTLKVSAEE